MTEPFAVEFQPEAGPKRRIRYDTRTDAAGWERIEERWTGCRWRTTGREPVSLVAVETLARRLL